MGDADDFVYYNPTAGLAVGGGEEESPEEMSVFTKICIAKDSYESFAAAARPQKLRRKA